MGTTHRKVKHMKQGTNIYQNFLDRLFVESPRAAYELEAMRYSLCAKTELNEADALEVCAKILLLPSGKRRVPVPTIDHTLDVALPLPMYEVVGNG